MGKRVAERLSQLVDEGEEAEGLSVGEKLPEFKALTPEGKELTLSSFLQGKKLVLVDVWAAWCGPCKMIAPILDEVAEEYTGKLTIAKLNIDDNPATAPKYGIRGIPTLLLFKNGSVAATKVGALSKTQLKEFLDENL